MNSDGSRFVNRGRFLFSAAGSEAAQSQRDRNYGGDAENWYVAEPAEDGIRVHD
jgi:hypothetical protein